MTATAVICNMLLCATQRQGQSYLLLPFHPEDAASKQVHAAGLLLLLLILFFIWKIRYHILCDCCLPPADEIQAQEAANLLEVAQAVHSSTSRPRASSALPQ